MNAYNIITQEIKKIVGEGVDFSVSISEDFSRGDYSTNLAFVLGKQKSITPNMCAEELVPILQEKLIAVVEKIEVAGPGFINFSLKKEIIREEILRCQKLETFTTKYTDKKVLVEHSSPNLFKPFSVGLLLNHIAGASLTHLMKAGGAKVTTVSFPSDISMGIAKAVYSIKKDGGLSQDIFNKSQEEVIAYLGSAYTRGVTSFDESESVQGEVKEIAEKLYSETPSEEFDIFEKGKNINVAYFEHMLSLLGSHFDGFIYESEAAVVGKEIVLAREDIFTHSEGAIVYIPDEGTKGVHTAVFINSQRNPTYEAKDLGLLHMKFERYTPDYSFFVTDNEQISHFNVVLDAASKIEKKWKEVSTHVYHGRMTFKGQKMSSRLGGVPLAQEILDVVTDEVKERSGEKIDHLTEEEKNVVYKQVALGALRFSMLRSKLGSSINFDPETSLSFEGDSGPYVQYTYARGVSLLAKGKELGFSPSYHSGEEVTILERKLMQWEGVALRAIEEIAPQYVVTYLFELAQMFNSFYASTPIVVKGDDLSEHRLAITESVTKVIKKALHLLAVEAPERM
ncbi:MAG: arginine--tRNA ligase [Candidatus Pacebacteria bacterium]|nr:arginine--tRNA ligase [Candidatus Paceibacterota bacterium]MBP9866778.1 arginine--tRNA ligase [Candidatus Paceibacterota bacterium]